MISICLESHKIAEEQYIRSTGCGCRPDHPNEDRTVFNTGRILGAVYCAIGFTPPHVGCIPAVILCGVTELPVCVTCASKVFKQTFSRSQGYQPVPDVVLGMPVLNFQNKISRVQESSDSCKNKG